LYKSFYKIIK